MKRLLQILALILATSLPIYGADAEKSATTNTVTATFYITEVKCAACVSLLNDSMRNVTGVLDIDGLTEVSGYARVSFDPKKADHQRIAQAVADTIQIHGEPFVAVLKLLIPDYAKEGNTAKVDALIAQQKDLVTLECRNRARGLFIVRFKPTTTPSSTSTNTVWKPEQLLTAVKKLGLDTRFVEEAPVNP